MLSWAKAGTAAVIKRAVVSTDANIFFIVGTLPFHFFNILNPLSVVIFQLPYITIKLHKV
ncbi:hypothetical protein YSY43_39830 [Paenibacillus sp. YSY-4.3]